MYVNEALSVGPVAFEQPPETMPLGKRLAYEARKLADECEAGTAPTLLIGYVFHPDANELRCAYGWVLARAGLTSPLAVANSIPFRMMKNYLSETANAIARANDSGFTQEARMRAVIAPLRAYANAVERL
jgi:hypothetical protein